jgi:hypothetical protein
MTSFSFTPRFFRALSTTTTHRTITRDQKIFNLPAPKTVTFDFTTPSSIRITIPTTSLWSQDFHWHTTDTSCEYIEFLPKGEWYYTKAKGIY